MKGLVSAHRARRGGFDQLRNAFSHHKLDRSDENQAETGDEFGLVVDPSSSVVSPKQIKDADEAPESHPGTATDLHIDENLFAFSPGQVGKLINPKSLAAFYQLGGLAGLEKGLRTDRNLGLSLSETHASSRVAFAEAIAQASATASDFSKESAVPQSQPNLTHNPRIRKSQPGRVRDSKNNRPQPRKGKSPQRKNSKGVLQHIYTNYKDGIFEFLADSARTLFAIRAYQVGTMEQHQHQKGKPVLTETVIMILALMLIFVYQLLIHHFKEPKLLAFKQKQLDREVVVVRSGKTMAVTVMNILVGDAIPLEPGDFISVDGVYIGGFGIKFDESRVTGQSDLVVKRAADEVFAAIESNVDTRGMDPFILSGTRVMEGLGTFLATSTNMHWTSSLSFQGVDKAKIPKRESPFITKYMGRFSRVAGAAGLLAPFMFILFILILPARFVRDAFFFSLTATLVLELAPTHLTKGEKPVGQLSIQTGAPKRDANGYRLDETGSSTLSNLDVATEAVSEEKQASSSQPLQISDSIGKAQRPGRSRSIAAASHHDRSDTQSSAHVYAQAAPPIDKAKPREDDNSPSETRREPFQRPGSASSSPSNEANAQKQGKHPEMDKNLSDARSKTSRPVDQNPVKSPVDNKGPKEVVSVGPSLLKTSPAPKQEPKTLESKKGETNRNKQEVRDAKSRSQARPETWRNDEKALLTQSNSTRSQQLSLAGIPRGRRQRLDRELRVSGSLAGIAASATPDFGSEFDIVSEVFAKNNQLQVDSQNVETFILPSGARRQFIGTVTAPWAFSGEPAVYQRVFHVVKSCVHQIVLGREFLTFTETFSKFTQRVEEVILQKTSAFRRILYVDQAAASPGSNQRMLGLINGRPVGGFPDTCSDISILRRDIVQRLCQDLPLIVQEDKTEVQFIDGTVAFTSGFIPGLDWCFGPGLGLEDTHRLDFFVMDNLPCGVILDKWLLWDNRAFEHYEDCFFDLNTSQVNTEKHVLGIKRVRKSKIQPCVVDAFDEEARRRTEAEDLEEEERMKQQWNLSHAQSSIAAVGSPAGGLTVASASTSFSAQSSNSVGGNASPAPATTTRANPSSSIHGANAKKESVWKAVVSKARRKKGIVAR